MTPPAHVLVVYEPSRRGEAAVRHAAKIATKAGARLSVVTVAVVEATDCHCCDTRSVYWNQVVRELAEDELAGARDVVSLNAAADFRVVSGESLPSAIAREAEQGGADMVVMPRRRSLLPWRRSRHVRQVQRRNPPAVVLLAPD